MPTYEYACAACAHEWETVQRITEPPLDVCPKCTKAAAHRLISAGTNFILKGGGWYSDLYASPKPTTKAETAEASPAAGPAGEAKSEPKADAPANNAPTAESKPVAKTPPAAAPGSPSSPST
ncbi:MAG: zinc ribbon domain-containing protein [Myxococcota bacterium]|nr:zinc ribbon domain-containing protein [Myxococcota bacterium]